MLPLSAMQFEIDSSAQHAQDVRNAQIQAVEAEEALKLAIAQSVKVKDLRQRPSTIESRAVLVIEDEHLADNFTCTTLLGPGMIAAAPFVFIDDTVGSTTAFYHVGRRLAGHAGLVHGGFIGVLLDECMGRACFGRMVGKIAVTAKLDLVFKAPMKVDSIICIHAETKDIQGRKAWVDATVEDSLDGRLLATASALFIEPKWASEMSKVL